MNLKKFISELKRRNVIKASIAYLAIAWILLQVFSILLPLVETPLWVLKTITLFMFIGFPIWVIFSWTYQLTSNGIIKNKSQEDILQNSGSKFNILIIIVLILGFLLLKSLWKTKKNIANELNQIEKKDSTTFEPEDLTTNLKALDFYLKGDFHLKKGTLKEIDTAIFYYNKAIENDSEFAKAYCNLSNAYMRKNISFDPNTKWEEEAYAAAGKALQLNPKLANPHITQAQFYWSESHNFSHEQAINELKIAIEKDPKLSRAYEQLSLVQLHIGLFNKALKNAQKSIELEPANYWARKFKGETLLFQGNYSNSLKEFKKIPANFISLPTQSLIALNLFYLNKPEKAIELLNNNLKSNLNNPNLNSVYAIILASKGQDIDAKKRIGIALNNSKKIIHAHHTYFHIAIASAIMNEKQEAVKWLKEAAKTGFPNFPLFNSDPNLINLKEDQEFKEFLIELKEKWNYHKSL